MSNMTSNKVQNQQVCKRSIQNGKSEQSQLEGQGQFNQCEKYERENLLQGNEVQNNWKKQLTLYLLARKKNKNCRNIHNLIQEASPLLALISGNPHHQVSISINHSLPNKAREAKTGPFIWGKLNKIDQGQILVLGHYLSNDKRQRLMFELNVIDISGRIVYSVVNLSKGQQVYASFIKIQKTFQNLYLLVWKKDELLQIYNKKQQFSDWCFGLDKFQAVWQYLNSQQKTKIEQAAPADCQIESNEKINLKRFSKSVKLFFLIKSTLENNLKKIHNREQNHHSLRHLMSLAYNIILPIIKNIQSSLEEQIRLQLPKIQEIVEESCLDDQKISLSLKNQNHHPSFLTNAHSCWKCKCRNYISCLTCSAIEMKTVSLCYDCYAPYHDLLYVRQSETIPALTRWEGIDQEVNRSIGIQAFEVPIQNHQREQCKQNRK